MARDIKGKIDEKVQVSGNYICDNCGHYQYFDKGDEFVDCQSCYEPDITWEFEY